MLTIHQQLLTRGYAGPPPRFGERWHRLFEPVRINPASPASGA